MQAKGLLYLAIVKDMWLISLGTLEKSQPDVYIVTNWVFV